MHPTLAAADIILDNVVSLSRSALPVWFPQNDVDYVAARVKVPPLEFAQFIARRAGVQVEQSKADGSYKFWRD